MKPMQGARVGLSAATRVTCPAAGRYKSEHAKIKQLLKAPLQAKHESPYRLLTKLYTFNDQHYAKVNHTTKHLTLSKQCTVPVFVSSLLVQCAKCGRQHTVWSGRHTQVGRLTRGFVDLWIGKFVDLWIRGFRETRESLKITQISVSLLHRPQSH